MTSCITNVTSPFFNRIKDETHIVVTEGRVQSINEIDSNRTVLVARC